MMPALERAEPVFVADRCVLGEHNRCPGLLPGSFCSCSCGHPSTRNVRAAGAVVLHDRQAFTDDHMFRAQARELLAMVGLIDGVGGREILPDDLRQNRPVKPGAPAANPDGPPLRLVDDEDDDESLAEDDDADLVHAPRSKRVTTPAGLQSLSPAVSRATTMTPARARPAKAPSGARQSTERRRKPRKVAAAEDLPSSPPPQKASNRRGTPAASTVVTTKRAALELKPIEHGSLTGYTTHCRRKIPIPPDDPCGCRAARKKYDQDRAAAKRQQSPTPKPTALSARRVAPVLPPIPHGTPEGWPTHHDRGALPVCDACTAAVAPPPPKPVSAAELLAEAQRSPDRTVARAAAAGVRLLVQIEAAPPSRVDRLLGQLADALADVSRAQARAASRTNGASS